MHLRAGQRATPVTRTDGYAPLRDYAAIGDGRTVALVARDGSVDWLPVPDLDSPSVFAGLLDHARGGRFDLAPETPYLAEHRYLPGTNVLETTFVTADGAVRVTDALTLPGGGLTPARELVRRVEGLAGDVPLRWRVTPRFGYGARTPRITTRYGTPVATDGAEAVAVCAWDAGEVTADGAALGGRFHARPGRPGLIALSLARQEPLVVPTRDDCEARLAHTVAAWRRWLAGGRFTGPWADAMARSALALKLLVSAPSGAVAAAATTSLPEHPGGVRNWDYRYSWVRDSAFTLAAFLAVGATREALAYFWWLLHASGLTRPRLRVLYRLDGGARAPERTLPLSGYRGSTPVRVGNGAAGQLQLDVYGELVQCAFEYASAGGRLDTDLARQLAATADLVCNRWREPDTGIWEVRSGPAHFTQSKMMCAVALDRAVRMAETGLLPDRHAPWWRREAAAVRRFVDTRCFDARRGAYVRAADRTELDAGVLLGLLNGYLEPSGPRFAGTVEAVARELSDGPLVYRYRADDGLPGGEGAFVACSFWLAEALAVAGHVDRAAELMDRMVGLANDVGLYSEEIDPATGEFLGNLPQALSHLSLINAADAIGKATDTAGAKAPR